jgi:hypothetical protein
MVAGDVTVQIVAATTTAIDTAVTAMRGASTDTWMCCSLANGQQVCIINIREA